MTPSHLDAIAAMSDQQLINERDMWVRHGAGMRHDAEHAPQFAQAIADQHAIAIARIEALETEMQRRGILLENPQPID